MDVRKEFICDNGKAELRRALISRRAALTDKHRRSAAACATVEKYVSGNVMVYVSIGGELDTEGLISALKARGDVKLFVPHTVHGEISVCELMQTGVADKLGNLPSYCRALADPDIKLDYCITPLLGFNERGFRIGYGKGCYDRFFRTHSECEKIGLAFDCQRCEFLPQPFDIPLDRCITETDVIYF